MSDVLFIPPPRSEEELEERYLRRMAPDRILPLVRQINARPDGCAGTIVFIAHRAYFQIQREALYLRRHGYHTVLLHMDFIQESLGPLFEESFDIVVGNVRDYGLLGAILQWLKVDIYHVQCWMLSYEMARFVIERKKQAACVCEFYDITSVYAPRDALCRIWSAEEVDYDLACERYIFHNADAIVHRFPQQIIEETAAIHGAKPPDIEMHPYPCSEYIPEPCEKLSNRDGILKLVYAGMVLPRNEAHPPELFPEASHAEAFEALLQQGFAIDVFSSPYVSIANGYEHLQQLAGEYHRFRLLEGVPPDALAKIIGAYDFGILLTLFDFESLLCTKNLIRGACGTKLFTYLEAGLPVLVNAEYEYMSRIVEENGMGLSIRSSDLHKIGDRIQAFDRAGAAKRIRAFNTNYGMHNQINRLIGLYKHVSSGRTEASGRRAGT